MNPVAALAHLLAVAIGGLGAFWLMGRIAPDLPDPASEPAVAAPRAPATGAEDGAEGSPPGAGGSLFREPALAIALDQLAGQLGAGQAIVRLRLEPGSLSSESRSSGKDLIEVSDVSPGAPELIVARISEERPEVTIDSVASMELAATERGPRWHVQLADDDPAVAPPLTYAASLEGELLGLGGRAPPPIPLSGR